MPRSSDTAAGWANYEWVGWWPPEPVVTGPYYAGDHYEEDNETVRVVLPEFPGWRFYVTFDPREGTAVGFEVAAGIGELGPPPRVSARLVRSLPIGEIQDLAKKEALRSKERYLANLSEATSNQPYTSAAHRWQATFDTDRQPGRRGRDDLEYAYLAAAYVAKVGAGSKRPVAELAEEMGHAPKQVRSALYEARERGLLKGAQRGVAAGELTEKARRLLGADSASGVIPKDARPFGMPEVDAVVNAYREQTMRTYLDRRDDG